jgi:hypothetical protein
MDATKPQSVTEREKRLRREAEALRANLARRKAQVRARELQDALPQDADLPDA